VAAALLTPSASQASGCAPSAGLSACFDANELWLPAGPASFVSLPDTRVTRVGQVSFGVASELLHHPVVLHVASPDRDGREVNVLDTALDASFFLGFGLFKNLELSMAAPTRLYQTGTGSGGVSSQTAPPLERNAVRNPRLGLGYSLDDTLVTPGVGLRLAFDASLPLGNESELSGERSIVAVPSVTLSVETGPFTLSASLGARLRRAIDFGSVRLGNQGSATLGLGVDVFDPGLLFLTVEAFALPPLGNSQAAAANSAISSESLFPAEWLLSVHSCFEKRGSWTLGVAGGSGIPLSSETRESSAGSTTAHFLGLGAPDFRSLVVLRFEAPEPAPAPRTK